MIAPARNLWPASSKSSSAASIFTSLFLNRNVTMVVVAGVIDDEDAAGAFDAARRLGIRRQQRHLLIEDRLLG